MANILYKFFHYNLFRFNKNNNFKYSINVVELKFSCHMDFCLVFGKKEKTPCDKRF